MPKTDDYEMSLNLGDEDRVLLKKDSMGKTRRTTFAVIASYVYSKISSSFVTPAQMAQAISGVSAQKGDKGDKGDTGGQGIQGIQGVKGDAGVNATTTQVATLSTDGLMSAAYAQKLNSIIDKMTAVGTVATPTLALGVPSSVTVTLSRTMPDVNYIATPMLLGGVQLGNVTVTELSRTTSSVTYRLQAPIAVTVTGNLLVFAVKT